MNFNEIEKLIEKDPERAVDEMLSIVKQYYGEVPYIL
ncbi:carboxymuconolactone decarboxylase family protein, partial [Methanosarcinales archaeon]